MSFLGTFDLGWLLWPHDTFHQKAHLKSVILIYILLFFMRFKICNLTSSSDFFIRNNCLIPLIILRYFSRELITPVIFKEKMVEWKVIVKGDFFENKLLLQSDVVFDSESNGRNFSSLTPPGGEKKWWYFWAAYLTLWRQKIF